MALPIPDWFSLDAAQIASDSRLQGHYLNATMSEEDFIADLDRLIPFACAAIKSGLRKEVGDNSFPFSLVQFATAYPDEQNAAHVEKRDSQNELASNAAKERVIYDLYRMLSGADNQAIAASCEKAANSLIETLAGEIIETRAALANNGKPNRAGWGSFSMGRPRDPASYCDAD